MPPSPSRLQPPTSTATTGSDFVAITVQDTSSDPPQGNTVVLEPPDPRDPRDIGRITLVSSQPGTIQASWEAPSEAPANYRISWAKVGEDFKHLDRPVRQRFSDCHIPNHHRSGGG